MTETFYNGSSLCPRCEEILNPVEVAFSGNTRMCATCRNEHYTENAKSAMTGPKNTRV